MSDQYPGNNASYKHSSILTTVLDRGLRSDQPRYRVNTPTRAVLHAAAGLGHAMQHASQCYKAPCTH